ncbi:hypothetical protein V6N11_066266 [Hibiscus sabdariffa]|uniref:Uncharacterized protein n=1 Tax=Hibiscus sabdariffa TaxID=183260 RepID=A0ABR1ZPJ1_9ROSI
MARDDKKPTEIGSVAQCFLKMSISGSLGYFRLAGAGLGHLSITEMSPMMWIYDLVNHWNSRFQYCLVGGLKYGVLLLLIAFKLYYIMLSEQSSGLHAEKYYQEIAATATATATATVVGDMLFNPGEGNENQVISC